MWIGRSPSITVAATTSAAERPSVSYVNGTPAELAITIGIAMYQRICSGPEALIADPVSLEFLR